MRTSAAKPTQTNAHIAGDPVLRPVLAGDDIGVNTSDAPTTPALAIYQVSDPPISGTRTEIAPSTAVAARVVAVTEIV